MFNYLLGVFFFIGLSKSGCYNSGTITISSLDSCSDLASQIDNEGNPYVEQKSSTENYQGYSWNKLYLKSPCTPNSISIYDSSSFPFLLQFDNSNIQTTVVNMYIQNAGSQWALYNQNGLPNLLTFNFYPNYELSDTKPFIFSPHMPATFNNKNNNIRNPTSN